jgi:hypothetical protein
MMTLQDILNEAIDRIMRSDQAGLDDLLAAHPEARPDVKPLLETAQALAAALPAQASPAFVVDLRRRLILQAATRRAEMQRRQQHRITLPTLLRLAPARRLAYAALAVVVAVALLLSSGGVATAQSLPGQPLYGTKRTVEDAPLLVLSDVVMRADYLLTLLERRVYEVEVLDRLGQINEIAFTEMRWATERALVAVQSVPLDRSAAQWTRLEMATEREEFVLTLATEQGRVPEKAQAAFAQTYQVCTSTQTQAQETLSTLPPQVGATATPPGWNPPGLTKTPEPPGQTKTPEPPGQTKTPPGQARTPDPSKTPKPTNTEKPANTPKPTYTEKPANTPKPTNTEKPANTPKPTSEPKPTKAPK